MTDKMPEIKKVIVEEGGKKSAPIFIPQSGDRVYDKELEIWATENERKRMRNKAEREPSKVSQSDKVAAIKEVLAHREMRKAGTKRYF